MSEKDWVKQIEAAGRHETPRMDPAQLKSFVERFIGQKERFLNCVASQGSPLYVFDEPALVKRVGEFKHAFEAAFEETRFFYAMKSNSHPFMLKTVIGQGCGIDVSSGEELKKALEQSPQAVIFSGPGKMEEELALACQNSEKVTVLIDSFGELKRLSAVAAHQGVNIRAGVRLTVDEKGLWRKFGIPLKRLASFFEEAGRCSNIELCGLQFHTSWNMDAVQQTSFLKRLGETLAGFDKSDLKQIQFLDIGGGYWPSEGEWLQTAATQEGKISECVNPAHGVADGLDHRCIVAVPIEAFAQELAQAMKTHIFPHVRPVIFCEPGRWISHVAMHILLRVVDKKDDRLVITDGGTQAVGWERFEHDYFPVINLSRPALKERECLVCGSLCTPHDLWGYSYFGQGIETGDVLLVPTQGAYTYSLRQEFIKPLPKEIVLSS